MSGVFQSVTAKLAAQLARLGNQANAAEGAGLVGFDGSTVASNLTTAIHGDQKQLFSGKLIVFCGDSTTEKMQLAGGAFDRITGYHAQTGMPLEGIRGVVNYGQGGYTLASFLSDAANPSFVGATSGNALWNWSGVKDPTAYGGIPLDDAVKIAGDVYVVSYGINDCGLTSTGTLSQSAIQSYFEAKLTEAVQRLRKALPKARLVLRIPNPLLARPVVGYDFPAAAVYPGWGADLTADNGLVEKWNLAMYAAYVNVAAANRFVELLDTWQLALGKYSPISVASNKHAFMLDFVHPNAAGYAAIADALVALWTGRAGGFMDARRVVAENFVTGGFGGVASDYYARMPLDTNRFTRVFSGSGTVAAAYIELLVPLATFLRSLSGSPTLTYRLADRAAGQIAVTPANVTDPDGGGTKTRIAGLVMPAASQGTGLLELFLDKEKANPDRMAGKTTLAIASGAGNTTLKLPAAGSYLLHVSMHTDDNNHARAGLFLVVWDATAPNAFAVVQTIGAQYTKGNAPSALTPTVANTGVVTLAATSAFGNATWTVDYSATRAA